MNRGRTCFHDTSEISKDQGKCTFHLYAPFGCLVVHAVNYQRAISLCNVFCRDVLVIKHSFTRTMGLCENNQLQGNYLIHDAVVHKAKCRRLN